MLFSPDGQVMASRYLMGGLKLWSIPEGTLLQSNRAVVGGGAFSSDGKLFAASDMGVARVFEVADGKERYSIPADFGPVSGVTFSPDGRLLLTWSSESYPARLWHTANGTQALEIPVQGVTAGAFTSDGTAVALAANGEMGLYSTSTGETIGSLGNHFPAVADIAFAPQDPAGEDARLAVLYGVNTDHNLLVNWNIPQGTQQFLSGAYAGISLAYTPESYGIAVGTWDGTVQMVDPEDGSLLRTFTGLSAQVQDLAINRWYQLAASSMNEVRIFALPDPNDSNGKTIAVPGGWVDQLAWSCYLATASMDGTIRLLDETGEEVVQTWKAADDGYENHLAITQDCTHVLVGKNRSIDQWQSPDWQALRTWTTPEIITALAISPDGSMVAVGLADGNIRLLERKTGALLRELRAHAGAVNALDFTMDGRYLASGVNDGNVIVWGVR
jgi:WD40 repeat protein